MLKHISATPAISLLITLLLSSTAQATVIYNGTVYADGVYQGSASDPGGSAPIGAGNQMTYYGSYDYSYYGESISGSVTTSASANVNQNSGSTVLSGNLSADSSAYVSTFQLQGIQSGGSSGVSFNFSVDSAYGYVFASTIDKFSSNANSLYPDYTGFDPLGFMLKNSDTNQPLFHDSIGDASTTSVSHIGTLAPGNYSLSLGAYTISDTQYGLHTNAADTYAFVLYQVSAVPVPAAIWLFGSGLLGLVSIARRKS